ncbi:MAG: hypothetical protein ABI651_03130, partial [Verrucomicrobiota bacterium]
DVDFLEPKGRASSPLRADGCNHAFLRCKGRRARSDAPCLGQLVYGTVARAILEVGVSYGPSPRIAAVSKGPAAAPAQPMACRGEFAALGYADRLRLVLRTHPRSIPQPVRRTDVRQN